ncbi:MAG: hypothetical protein KDA72_14370 [Planctomycetales bacterium]|nr:hypothetical protein [Planctomycetales bacterium]
MTLLPESTNAVLAIDVAAILESPLAKSNHWSEPFDPKFAEQLTRLPPDAQRFVLATELGLDHLEPVWEFAALKVNHAVDVETLRADIDGRVDSLAGKRAVRTERESVIVPFRDNRLGLIRIAPRAWAALQVRHAETRSAPCIAPFLADAVVRAGGQTQIVIALNVEDALPMEVVRNTIARSTLLANSEVALDALAETFSSLQGFVLTVQVTDSMHGKLEMVFRNPPSLLSKFSKPLMLDLLASAGSSLPEFYQWQPSQVDNALAIEGELSIDGLRKLLSLLHYDVSDMVRSPEGTLARATKPVPHASAEYAKRVTRIVDSLKAVANDNSFATQVLWTDRAAKSIMRLSTRNVQPEIADLGTQIAYELSDIVSIFHNAENTAVMESSAQAKPAIQWHSRLVPYEGYRTPYGVYFRYMPLSVASVNVGENLQHRERIEMAELSKANQRATEKFYEIQKKVDELGRQAELPKRD